MEQIARDHFGTWTRNYRALERYQQLTSRPEDRVVNVTFLYGKPGTGKTHWVNDNSDPADTFWFSPQPNACFFDGYEGQSTLVLDDFIGGHVPRNMLLRLLDKYALRLPIKGSSRIAKYSRVFITSNYWPSAWYKDRDNLWAIQRRIGTVLIFERGDDPGAFVEFAPNSPAHWNDIIYSRGIHVEFGEE